MFFSTHITANLRDKRTATARRTYATLICLLSICSVRFALLRRADICRHLFVVLTTESLSQILFLIAARVSAISRLTLGVHAAASGFISVFAT
jgi:hypothetical protein